MSDYEQNPINGSQPPQGDSQSNTGYTPYQQPGTYYTPPQPEQPQTPPTGDNGTTLSLRLPQRQPARRCL